MSRYVNPYTDFGFKCLFGSEGSKELLIDFLNSVLPEKHQIAELSFLNTEKPGKVQEERKVVFDLFCKAKSGERFIVEMQKEFQEYFRDRSIVYASRAVIDQAKRGKWDYRINPVYLIAILDFEIDAKEEEKEFLEEVSLKNKNGKEFFEKLQFKFLQMPLFKKKEKQLKTQQDKWLYFLKHLEDFDNIPAILNEKVFKRAFRKAELAAMSKAEQDAYEHELDIERDNYAVMKTKEKFASERGHSAGYAAGQAAGHSAGYATGQAAGHSAGYATGQAAEKLEIARKMKAAKIPAEQIAALTGLTAEEIKGL